MRIDHLCCFFLVFCLSSGVVKRLLYETKTRKKKDNRLFYLAKNKQDCVEMLLSKSVKDGIIDHNEFTAIMKEKKTMIVKKMNEV